MTQPYDERPVAPADDTPAPDTASVDGPGADVPAVDAALDAEVPAHGEPTTPEPGFGDPRVDDAVARLEELTERPVSEHAEVFDDIHRRLRDVLEEAADEPAEEHRG